MGRERFGHPPGKYKESTHCVRVFTKSRTIIFPLLCSDEAIRRPFRLPGSILDDDPRVFIM